MYSFCTLFDDMIQKEKNERIEKSVVLITCSCLCICGGHWGDCIPVGRIGGFYKGLGCGGSIFSC